MSAQDAPVADYGALAKQVVDQIEEIEGKYDGARAAHAKGTLCAGEFTPAPAAAELTTAAHFQGGPVRTHIRFSNGSARPSNSDLARDGHGMAVKFYLDGSTTDIVCLDLPQFFVRTPEDFTGFLAARGKLAALEQPGKALRSPLSIPRAFAGVGFMLSHREAWPALKAAAGFDWPASYLTISYNSIHSFIWTGPDGTSRDVRYRWIPETGEQRVPAKEVKPRGRDYLQDDLANRLGSGPWAFTLEVKIAQAGDEINDPTVAWPEDRERVTVGRLVITELAFDRDRDGDVLVFDPTRVTDGIDTSDDPILLFRSKAYEESVLRRSGVQRA
jgi:catalase